jgi:glycosyl transferase family 87
VSDPRAASLPLTIGLIALRVVVLAIAIHVGRSAQPTDDLLRFRGIVSTPGTPYRSFPVEYAPGEVLFIEGIGSTDPSALATRLALAAFVADIAAWSAVRYGWGSGAAQRYLWIGAPLLVFLYGRFDLVPVALAAWGAALAVRGFQRAGGVVFASGIVGKLWPVVLLPAFLIRGHRRAFGWACGVSAAVAAGWLAFAGTSGVTGLVTFRHARGWGVESTVGTLVWIVTGGPVRLEAGSPRVGTAPRWTTALLAGVLVVLLVSVWRPSLQRDRDPFGAASVAAICGLLACSPLFSLQFAAWLLPWGAVAWADRDRRTFRSVAAIEALTAVLFVVYSPHRALAAQVLLLLRSALVLWVLAAWLLPQRASAAVPEDLR